MISAELKNRRLRSIEMCAGAGGQALGLEQAGFSHAALVEIDEHCRTTLALNRPAWRLPGDGDLTRFDGRSYRGEIDLLAGGLPCPPFSVAGNKLGKKDERNLFPAAIRLVDEIRPKAVMIENVRGILDAVFEDYRQHIAGQLKKLGYTTQWKLLNASDFGVPQLRPRVVFVAVKNGFASQFDWPESQAATPPTVGKALYDLMAEGGWKGASIWKEMANKIAPTIIGGSKKHGGPDLGPTRAKRAWETLSVDGHQIANEPPPRDFVGMPRLTVRMVARLQGFPDEWKFSGRKTPAYRQVGNAFPPPVAKAVGEQLLKCLTARILVPVKAAG